MTEIEAKALALVNEVFKERDLSLDSYLNRTSNSYHEALCRAIEQHEAFKLEVSEFALGVKGYMASVKAMAWQSDCDRLIVAKPNPLVEALKDKPFNTAEIEIIRAALAARGLKIVEVGHD